LALDEKIGDSDGKIDENEKDVRSSTVRMFDAREIASEEDIDRVLLHCSTGATLQHCERIQSKHPPLVALLRLTRSILDIRLSLKRALPNTTEPMTITSTSTSCVE
jgi:hypothetical protein